jgi:hypothetical protein
VKHKVLAILERYLALDSTIYVTVGFLSISS